MSTVIPDFFYTAEQSRAVDRRAIEAHGCSGPALMARAARAAFQHLLRSYPEISRLQVLCGPGNNGGDGLLLAMLAHAQAIPTAVFLLAGEPRSEDGKAAFAKAKAAGVAITSFSEASLVEEGIVVDAMLGTGVAGPLRDSYAHAVAVVNGLGVPVVALDVPTGVCGDSGKVFENAVKAHSTISFITAKRGLYTALGSDYAGQVLVDDLDVPADAFAAAGKACRVLSLPRQLASLQARRGSSHKGHFGKVLVVGGDRGMGGAVILAAEAALRCGAGLVRVATREAHIAPLLARRPEAMAVTVDHRNDLDESLPWADTIVVGPGLGQDPWGEQLLQACLDADKKTLLDADALNLLATLGARELPSELILTPHPAEAARLLGISVSEVQGDRFLAIDALVKKFAATVVLKGNGTLVSGPESDCSLNNGAMLPSLCVAGNPGMASGGMGDVLSGMLGALLNQMSDFREAAELAVELHACAGDRAAEHLGEMPLLPSDLLMEAAELLP
ncbi:MAG: NAD(P)H-hydrate dehydratase [Pseudomonadota bacterium]